TEILLFRGLADKQVESGRKVVAASHLFKLRVVPGGMKAFVVDAARDDSDSVLPRPGEAHQFVRRELRVRDDGIRLSQGLTHPQRKVLQGCPRRIDRILSRSSEMAQDLDVMHHHELLLTPKRA